MVLTLVRALLYPALAQTVLAIPWAPHDTTRPLPPVVVAPTAPAVPAPPPSDAVVLFGGSDASAWRSARGDAIGWRVVAGALEVAPGAGDIFTRQGFGDCQLHVEWMTPAPPTGSGQNRGNSGVYLMGLYEVQVLDSYENRTYADGMAGAVYGQYPPLVNASRPPGEWQSYDIVFRRPRFDPRGALVEPAHLTVFHNGVLIQNHVTLTGPTAHQRRPPYEAHADRLPVKLQDHGAPVKFRNVWIRDLERAALPDPAPDVFQARFETTKGAFVVAGGGMRGGKQGRILAEGNAHLDRDFPKLDRLMRATIVSNRP